MKRELLTPLALTVGALLAAASCTTDDPDPVSTGPGDPPVTTSATPSTLPTLGGTDPVTPGVRPQPFGSSRLGFFGDCPALLDYMQGEASARVTPWGLDGGGLYYGGGVVPMSEEAAVDDFDARRRR